MVFFRLGRVNPAMEFIGGGTSKGLLLVFCLRAITNGAMGVPCIFTKEKAQKPHHERKKESDVHEGHYG